MYGWKYLTCMLLSVTLFWFVSGNSPISLQWEMLFMSAISYLTKVLPFTPQARCLNCVCAHPTQNRLWSFTNTKQTFYSPFCMLFQTFARLEHAFEWRDVCIDAQSINAIEDLLKIYSSELAGNLFNTRKQKAHKICFVLFWDRYHKSRILCLYGVCKRHKWDCRCWLDRWRECKRIALT